MIQWNDNKQGGEWAHVGDNVLGVLATEAPGRWVIAWNGRQVALAITSSIQAAKIVAPVYVETFLSRQLIQLRDATGGGR